MDMNALDFDRVRSLHVMNAGQNQRVIRRALSAATAHFCVAPGHTRVVTRRQSYANILG